MKNDELRFDELNIDEIAGDLSRAEATNEDFLKKFVQLPKGSGNTVCRILPRLPNRQVYQCTRVHTLQHGSSRRVFHCSRELVHPSNGVRWRAASNEADCVICRYYSRLWAEIEKMPDGPSKEAKKNAARAIKPVERYYYNVIVRSDKDAVPKIYSCGKTVHQIILKAIVGSDGERGFGDVSHPISGRDFKIVKTIKGDFPDYAQSRFLDVSPLGTQQQVEKWLDGRHDLEGLRQVKPYTEMYQALMVHCGKAQPSNSSDDADLLALTAEPVEDKTPAVTPASQIVVVTHDVDPDEFLDDDWKESFSKF